MSGNYFSTVLCKCQKSVCQTVSSLVFVMDSAVLEIDTIPCLVHCICLWRDNYLGRAGVQLKLLDIFYIPGVLYIFSLTVALSPQENSERIFCPFEIYNVKTLDLLI